MKEESSLPSGRIQWYAFIKAERPESPAAEDPAAFLRETLSGQETHACPFLFVRYLFEAVHYSHKMPPFGSLHVHSSHSSAALRLDLQSL